ncbi:Ig-like domain-containing protein [Chloroflexota bacterium]
MMRKFVLLAIIITLVISMAATVHAAPPPEGPPGLQRAIEAKEAHTDVLMAIPGVVGTAVGLGADNEPVVKVYAKSAGVAGLPRQLDGVPVSVQVTGEIVALDKPQNPGSKGGGRNKGDPVADSEVVKETSTIFDINLTGSNRGGCGSNFTFTITSGPMNGNLNSSSGTMACQDGNLTANVKYTTDTNNFFDSFTFTISDGDNESNEARVTIVVGFPSRSTPADTGTSSGTGRLYKSKGSWWCTVGTLGARLTDGTNVYALSNNHVYALEGIGEIGDWILQPGRADMTGCGTPDEINEAIIGYLAAYVPLQFKGKTLNKVDAAVAWSTTGMVGQSTPTGYTPSSSLTTATLGLDVKKYGRTTGLTSGEVVDIHATISVRYDSGTARFDDQIGIVGDGVDFSAGGDSGSLIVTDVNDSPVALLFAGGGAYTFGNPIQAVLDELKAELGVATLDIDDSP